MTLFEYLAIAFSLIFSFSGMRLVAGLPHAAERRRRYWVHLSFLCFQLLATVLIFWLFWSFRNVEWNFPTFLLVLASPGLIYFNACALVPEDPSAVESWHDYYYSNRRRYFIGLCCWILVVATISTVVLKLPLVHPARALQAISLSIAVVGATSANERVHSGLVILSLAVALLIAFTTAFRPGPFGSP
jgi:NADH:ubiquinone oxidoreductase subunit 6 (subunit J)